MSSSYSRADTIPAEALRQRGKQKLLDSLDVILSPPFAPQICRGARNVTTIWGLGYENGGVSLRGLGRANGMAFFFSSSVAAAPHSVA